MASETLVVDYSFDPPTATAIAHAGHVAVGRYVAPGGTSGKWIGAAERARLHAAGLALFLVFEGGANRATAGFAAGQDDADAALKSAHALGYPRACPLFFAVDFAAEPAAVAAYFKGVNSVLGSRAGVYGGIKMAGQAPFFWQTAAWSAGKLSPAAHIYQRVHMTHPVPGCDENVICRPIVLDAPHGPATYMPGGVAPVQVPIGTKPPTPVPAGSVTRGAKVDAALAALKSAGGVSAGRRAVIARVRALLLSLVPWKK